MLIVEQLLSKSFINFLCNIIRFAHIFYLAII